MTLQAKQQTILFRGGEWKPTYTLMLVPYFSLMVDVGLCDESRKWTELLRKESMWLALRKNKICQITCLVWNSNRRVETCLVIDQNTSVKGIGLQQANNYYVSYTCAWHIQIYRMLNPWEQSFPNPSICSITCFAGIDVPWSEPPHLSVIAIICEVNLWSDAHNFASTMENWQGEWGKNSTEQAVTEMSALREVPLLSHPSIFYCLLNQDSHGSLGVIFFSLHNSENKVSHILHEKTALNKLESLITLIKQKNNAWALKKTPFTIGWSRYMLSRKLSPNFRGHSVGFRRTSC